MTNGKTARIRNTVVIMLLILGVLLSVLSIAADYFGLDKTPGFGMIQMFELLVGITCLTIAGFVYLRSLGARMTRSLQADIGGRLAATGLVFSYVTGLADLMGIGTHPHPDYERPFVGWLQWGGLTLGILSIVVGLLLYYTSRRIRPSSSMEFITNGNGKT